jgi:hypothetical protein
MRHPSTRLMRLLFCCVSSSLTIKDVTATVHLEARLHEVTVIVQSVLQSLNLNPILLALAQGVVTDVGGLLGPATSAATSTYGRPSPSATGTSGR